MATKFSQLLVPNYSDAIYTRGQAPLSYLRMGCAFSAADDDTLPPNERGLEWISQRIGVANEYFFKDDKRAAELLARHRTAWLGVLAEKGIRTEMVRGLVQASGSPRKLLSKKLASLGAYEPTAWVDHLSLSDCAAEDLRHSRPVRRASRPSIRAAASSRERA